MNTNLCKLDVLAIGAHPDDIEAGAGGFLAKSKKNNLKTGMIVLTNGSAGAFGNAEVRTLESQKAAEILEVDFHEILNYEDAGLTYTKEDAEKLGDMIRVMEPSIVLCPWESDYHPDHIVASKFVDQAVFLAGRGKGSCKGHSPNQTLYFSINVKSIVEPDIILDITDVWDKKKNSLLAHESQSPVLQAYELLATYYGFLSGVRYGEGFKKRFPLRVKNVGDMF